MNHNSERRNKAKEILKGAGYGSMKHPVEKDVKHHAHKTAKKSHLHLATGGYASGGSPKARMDRKARASGGRNKHKGPSKVSVNVINAGKQPVPVPAPAMERPAVAPQMAAPRPPMAAPQGLPPGIAPPGGMPPRPGMMNRGGRSRKAGGGPVKSSGEHPHLKAGSGSGLGRLEKAAAEKVRKK